MVVRFQVDPDFYDHPKSIGLSDAATALWVRAGSYSAAKLLDGSVPEHVLSSLSKTPEEASAELVARGLWRRTRGGFRFHEWSQRNLTRARVDADREYERERKQRQRKAASQNGYAEVMKPDVPPGLPPGLRVGQDRDSRAGPDRSVSVSLSVSKTLSSAPPKDDEPAWVAFWAAYPHRVGKGAARKAWAKALTRATAEEITAAAAAYAKERQGQDRRYTAHPATWLNAERWTDDRASQQPTIDDWWDP